MGESTSHIALVSSIAKWLEKQEYFGSLITLADIPSSIGASKPPIVGGFAPDVWAKNIENGSVIIGEAKTLRDIENRHSSEQFSAFLKFCNDNKPSLLVVAVPWMMVNCAKSHIEYLKRKTRTEGVQVVFLDMLPA